MLIALQFLLAVCSFSLFIKITSVWCAYLIFIFWENFVRLFCAFCQKMLDISRLAVRSYSLCFVTLSTLKNPLELCPISSEGLGTGSRWQSQQPISTPPGMCSLLQYGARLIRISSGLPLICLPSVHSN